MSLDDDLARWEAGYLSREELIASYASSERNLAQPFEKNLERTFEKNLDRNLERNLDKNLERTLLPDVAPALALVEILDLHERLVDIGREPLLYRESDWDQLRDSLPDRLPVRRVFGTGRLARPLIAASMVVGLTAGAAAASPTVREHMISVWHGIQHNIGLVDDPIQVQNRSPITGSQHAPGQAVGGADGTTEPGNSGGPLGHSGDHPGSGGDIPGNGGDSPGNGGGNTGEGPGDSDGTTGGGNSGSPGNSDGTTGGGNSGSPGNSDGTTGGGNSGSPGNSDGTTGGGNSGSPGNSDGTTGGGNSGSPGNSDGTPGGGNSGENPGQGNGGTDNPGQGNGGGTPGQGGGNSGDDPTDGDST